MSALRARYKANFDAYQQDELRVMLDMINGKEAQCCNKAPTPTIGDSPWNPQGPSVVGRGHATRAERSEGQDS